MTGRTMAILQVNLEELLNSTPVPTQAITENVVDGVTRSTTTWDSFMQLVGLVFLLIIILIAAYYTSKFIAGIKLGQMKESNFKVIDSYRISPNKVMQIVKVGNKYLVIAIGKDTINFITELEEAEVFIREFKTGEKLDFKQILDKLTSKTGEKLDFKQILDKLSNKTNHE